MKKFVTKFLAIMLLLSGMVFGAGFTSLSLTQPVYADEDDLTPPITDHTPAEETEEEVPDAETPEAEEGESPDTPETEEGAEEGTDEEETTEENIVNTCEDQTGALSWIVCPSTSLVATVTDALYGAINDFLVVNPVTMDDHAPIYLVWQYARNITNIVFVIFLILVIYSQLTGLGISNYGIKRILPRLIITVVLVNLSFIICALGVDLSNLIGSGLRDFFKSIQDTIMAGGIAAPDLNLSFLDVLTYVLGGGSLAGIAIGAAAGGLGGLFWMLVTALIGALVAVASGLLTIAARQALVSLLIMIAPLAFVAYLLPNTEKWFTQWKNLLLRMLVFYPMFSFLYGASQLAGWAIIASATSGFGVILGVAVQVVPLILSWSLMKMSGTILGTLNTGLRSAFAPIQRGLTGWSTSHGEQARQNYFARNTMPGSHLRSYLDHRRTRREEDTKNALEIRQNRALDRALTDMTSSAGRDEEGTDTWSRRANRYTRTAKRASYTSSRVAVKRMALENTLSAYGDHFKDAAAQRLSDDHADAFLESAKQQFLAQNQAQSDQDWLLNRFIGAAASSETNPYDYNRLIRGAHGGLGHLGEASIMGQVIAKSVEIENRRRVEARVIATKFGYSKTAFRGMVFDKNHIDDNGFETDEFGNRIENDHYELIEGKKHLHKTWQKYIGINKETGEEITKEEYDALSTGERANYRKVRYCEIRDDNKNLVQRIYEDDAGYMKELLRDDIAIGDPIVDRYATTIGVAAAEGEVTGILRKYHSTISAAMNDTGYKTHDAAFTPMLTSQINNGYVTTKGQLDIAKLQSFSVAAKAGNFLQNDGFVIERWINILNSLNSTEEGKRFEDYFSDFDIENYRNVNGEHLKGLRAILDEDGNQIGWKEINQYDTSLTVDEQRNYLKHKIIPKAAMKMFSFIKRNATPNVLENMKEDGREALENLTNLITSIGFNDADSNTAFGDRIDFTNSIFKTKDPGALKQQTEIATQFINAMLGNVPQGDLDGADFPDTDDDDDMGDYGDYGENPMGGTPDTAPEPRSNNPTVGKFTKQIGRGKKAKKNNDLSNDLSNILQNLTGIFYAPASMADLCDNIEGYFRTTPALSKRVIYDNCIEITSRYRRGKPVRNDEEVVRDTVNNKIDAAAKNALYREILQLVYSAMTTR